VRGNIIVGQSATPTIPFHPHIRSPVNRGKFTPNIGHTLNTNLPFRPTEVKPIKNLPVIGGNQHGINLLASSADHPSHGTTDFTDDSDYTEEPVSESTVISV